MIQRKAIQAIHAAICEESFEDHMDPEWPGRCVKAAQAAYPHLMAQALREAADRIMGPSDALLDSATCRWNAMELRERAAHVEHPTNV